MTFYLLLSKPCYTQYVNTMLDSYLVATMAVIYLITTKYLKLGHIVLLSSDVC